MSPFLRRGVLRSPDGFTLPEVLIAAAILVAALASVYSVLFSVQRGVEMQIDRAQSVDQVRLAVQQIQHEVLSASAVTVPAAGNGLSMDVFTRTNQPTRYGQTDDTKQSCTQWRINGGQLQTRRWLPPWTVAQSAPWMTVASSITNDASNPLFEIDDNDAYADRLVNISVRANANPASGNDVLIDASVLGRNIVFGGSDPCATDQPT